MSDTLMTIVAIVLAAILMFIFPLMTMADRADDVAQTQAEKKVQFRGTTTTDISSNEYKNTATITINIIP